MGTYAPTNDDGAVARLPIGGEGEAKELLATIRLLSRARTREEIMAVVSHAVRALLGADGATFVLRDGDRCYYAEEDAISPLWKGRRFPMSACISGWCMANNQAVAIPDIQHDSRVPAEAYRPTFVRSLAMAPVGPEEPIAALGAYWSEVRQADPEQMECLQAIADAAALATANVQGRGAEPGDRRSATPAPPRQAGELKRSGVSDRSWPQRFIDAVRHNRLRPNSVDAFAFAGACVVIATVLRLAVTTSGVHGLVIYSTYYPAALLATLIGGRAAGILAAALGGVAAHWLFAPQLRHFAPFTVSDALNLALYGGACALIILIIDWYQRIVLRLQQEDARHLTLACEQRHRVRNAIAVVEAIVQLSLGDEPDRAKSINRRIRAGLAEIDIKDQAAKQPVGLRDLLTVELQPYGLERFLLEGQGEPSLPCAARGVLALAVHELTTNALKYGALSVPDGRVKVNWRTHGGQLTISWRETGGPLVQPPQKRGYGSIMLRRLVEAVGGNLAVEFQPAGVTAEITLALEPARRDQEGAEAGGLDLDASA